MKVVLFNGSPRKEGNTFHALQVVINELNLKGIECEYFWIGNQKIQGCLACYKCAKNKNKKCSVTSDKINSYIAKIL